jgi:hypothetical protein
MYICTCALQLLSVGGSKLQGIAVECEDFHTALEGGSDCVEREHFHWKRNNIKP